MCTLLVAHGEGALHGWWTVGRVVIPERIVGDVLQDARALVGRILHMIDD